MVQLESRSTVEEKLDSSTETTIFVRNSKMMSKRQRKCLLDSVNQSSQANAVPHANAASKSSLPARVVRPVTSNASATYMATYSETPQLGVRRQTIYRAHHALSINQFSPLGKLEKLSRTARSKHTQRQPWSTLRTGGLSNSHDSNHRANNDSEQDLIHDDQPEPQSHHLSNAALFSEQQKEGEVEKWKSSAIIAS